MSKGFSLERAKGEASLVKVARGAKIEGVWLYQDGQFSDISTQQDATRASFSVRTGSKSPFTVYHIHPAKEGSPGGFIEIRKGFKIAPPSLEDLDSYLQLRKKFGDQASCAVADGWGIWSFGLTDPDEIRTLTEKRIYLFIREAWIKHSRGRLPIPKGDQRRFSEAMREHGMILSYESVDELYAKVIPS